MKPLSLRKIAEVTNGIYHGSSENLDSLITGVVRDNRDISSGNLFVCFKGERVDGHDFAADAYSSGAICCLAEHELSVDEPYILVSSTFSALKLLAAYYRSLFSIPIIGITGSVGKTTAKEMIASVLSKKYNTLKTQGNLNNEIGVPLTLLSLKAEHEVAVIEMGINTFGEMSRLAQMVRPDIFVMTNIGNSHLAFLEDKTGVLRAKSEAFEYMSKDSTVILNGDDALLFDLNVPGEKIRYGFSNENDFHAKNISNTGSTSIQFDILSVNQRFHASVNALGKPIVYASLAAAAVGHRLSVPEDAIIEGLSDYTTIKGRARIFDTGYITILDDCYNANPNSMIAAIESLCSLPGRRVAILGDMGELGDQESDFHREIGYVASRHPLDLLLCCGTLSKFIYDTAISNKNLSVWYFPDKDELFCVLPSLILKSDTVLVKASNSMKFSEIVDELEKLA